MITMPLLAPIEDGEDGVTPLGTPCSARVTLGGSSPNVGAFVRFFLRQPKGSGQVPLLWSHTTRPPSSNRFGTLVTSGVSNRSLCNDCVGFCSRHTLTILAMNAVAFVPSRRLFCLFNARATGFLSVNEVRAAVLADL